MIIGVYPERDFEVFTTPDIHPCVVFADIEKVLSIDGE